MPVLSHLQKTVVSERLRPSSVTADMSPPPERFWRWWRRGKVTNRLAKKKKNWLELL